MEEDWINFKKFVEHTTLSNHKNRKFLHLKILQQKIAKVHTSVTAIEKLKLGSVVSTTHIIITGLLAKEKKISQSNNAQDQQFLLLFANFAVAVAVSFIYSFSKKLLLPYFHFPNV